MPYYVHVKGLNIAEKIQDGSLRTPEDAREFTSRADAHSATATGEDLIVSFVISGYERTNWRRREYQRFQDSVYVQVPWVSSVAGFWKPHDSEDSQYCIPKECVLHFAHLSLKTPGSIAYTPDNEAGYQDRQVTTKVGRYLEKFLSAHYTAEQIANYTARVKGATAGLLLATSTEDIVRVYLNGPNSCMSYEHTEYASSPNQPCEVYGESDLAVAYLGNLSDVSARCVVWPEKKWYSRIYGDATLRVVLVGAGYEKAPLGDHDPTSLHGSFEGAKIRAIPHRRGFVCPYLDMAQTVSLSRDRQWLILRDDQDGDYSVHETDGLTDAIERHSCEHRGESISENESYCESCDNNRYCCNRCGESSFGEDSGECVNDDWYCDYCVRTHYTHECELCSRTWTEVNPDHVVCSRCVDHAAQCTGCDSTFDTRESDDPENEKCEDCYTAPEEAEEAEEITSVETVSTDAPAVDPTLHLFPAIANEITVYIGNREPKTATIARLSGALALHRGVETQGNPGWVITHVLSGLVVTRKITYLEADRLLDLLSTPGIDWTIVREDNPLVSSATELIVRHILREGSLPENFVHQVEAVCPS